MNKADALVNPLLDVRLRSLTDYWRAETLLRIQELQKAHKGIARLRRKIARLESTLRICKNCGRLKSAHGEGRPCWLETTAFPGADRTCIGYDEVGGERAAKVTPSAQGPAETLAAAPVSPRDDSDTEPFDPTGVDELAEGS